MRRNNVSTIPLVWCSRVSIYPRMGVALIVGFPASIRVLTHPPAGGSSIGWDSATRGIAHSLRSFRSSPRYVNGTSYRRYKHHLEFYCSYVFPFLCSWQERRHSCRRRVAVGASSFLPTKGCCVGILPPKDFAAPNNIRVLEAYLCY